MHYENCRLLYENTEKSVLHTRIQRDRPKTCNPFYCHSSSGKTRRNCSLYLYACGRVCNRPKIRAISHYWSAHLSSTRTRARDSHFTISSCCHLLIIYLIRRWEKVERQCWWIFLWKSSFTMRIYTYRGGKWTSASLHANPRGTIYVFLYILDWYSSARGEFSFSGCFIFISLSSLFLRIERRKLSRVKKLSGNHSGWWIMHSKIDLLADLRNARWCCSILTCGFRFFQITVDWKTKQ